MLLSPHGSDAGRRLRRSDVSGIAALLVLVLLGAHRDAEAVMITEIMYHPSAGQEAEVEDANLEWIEIHNDEPTIVNLSGYWFSQGVNFVFPHDTYLEGGEYLVLCADEDAVREKYGITNTIGNFIGRLDNEGETISLNIFGGGVDVTVDYADRGQWMKEADGTGHTIALIDIYEDPDDNDNWAKSEALGGTPGGPNIAEPVIVETILIDEGDVWLYHKNIDSYPPGNWFDPGYDADDWFKGATGLGYGDDDDATVLDDMEDLYQSFATRKEFDLTQGEIDGLTEVALSIKFDDGFVAYINGVEVARVGLTGAGNRGDPYGHRTNARSHEARNFENFSFSKSLLVPGGNVLAIGLHNATLSSSDCSFIPRLIDTRLDFPTAAGDPVPVVINECLLRTDGEGWIELYNTSSSSVDLSGYHLSDENNELDRFVIPDGTTISGHGFVSFTASTTGFDFSGTELAIFFSRPNLLEVLDAAHFDNPIDIDPILIGTSEARVPDGDPRFSTSTSPTPGAANDVTFEEDIVINEIMYHPPREHLDLPYIELYNRGDAAVDISGFRFNRGVSFTFPANTIIGSGEFVVVAENPTAVETAHGIAGVLGPWTGTLAYSDENIRLVDTLGNTADEVHFYDGGSWPALADGGGSSLELLDPDQDNNIASAWAASDETQKSDWEEIEYSLSYARQGESEFQIRMLTAAEVLIDDVTVTRGGTQYIRNPSFETSTTTWIIQGTHIESRRTTDDSFDRNASLHVIASGKGDTRVNRIETETSPRMESGTYQVHVATRWLSGGNLIFFSCFNQYANCQVERWLTIPRNLGTPGAPNSESVANLGPIISDVVHSPASPVASQSVTIVATVADSDGVDSVIARYDPSSGNSGSVELFDDGAHSDGAAGDGVYGGTISGFTTNVKVKFYIEAEDSLGATRTEPREAPARDFVYQHSTVLTANSFTFRVIHDPANWSQLNGRHLHSNHLLDATFVFNEDKVFYNVGTRYRGSPWNRPGNPRMYRITFGKDKTYRRLRKINLTKYGSAQTERAAGYAVWRNSTTSRPSPFNPSTWGRVRTTAGTFMMEAQRPWDTSLLRLWFPEDADGYLMKITGKQIFSDGGSHNSGLLRWGRWINRGPRKSSYRWNFNHRTRELEDNFMPLVELLAGMNRSAARLDAELEDIMDVEQFLRVYAARCAQDDWDTISIGNGQNMYCYFAENEGRWKLLPWDMDHTWGNANARTKPDNTGDGDSAMRNILLRPKYNRMYLGVINEMINGRGDDPGYWSTGEMVAKFLDRNTAALGRDGVASAIGIRNFITQRRSRLSSLLPSRQEFRITTEDGEDFAANEASTRMEGIAWIDVDSILLNGVPLDITWTNTTRWRTEVDLDAGDNEFSFVAIDVEGNIVGTDTIVVTSSVGWTTPAIVAVTPGSAMPGEQVTITGTDFHNGIVVLFDGVESPSVSFDEDADPSQLTAEVPFLRDGEVQVVVKNIDDRDSDPSPFTVDPLPPEFVRGDANMDEVIGISDAVRIVRHLFAGVATPCRDALDADGDNELTVTDALRVLGYLYQDAVPPATPFPAAGTDPDSDAAIDCEVGLDVF
jgi:hypothetical protein